ncbi:chemotaxis-specific protein-glutamate methyltransferase CheB [Pseudomarimonas arenosa]|uniref:Protein-glutamate methylesterase/protein-glutamine glutaminase n=1 Tax=Pseudomarimonas arenosa TaxID=2774145 RepID=A0AAW3ZLC3_9GAMM|nr:chemotaxis-specific protein-glutamate methyltransferase CheB [Pseudomarimonas arenosa]MBD8526768.1 chemotaxis-specific protein-glutamate methyltransferase CheB [Pseudomarimonas arenosa]
MNRRLRVLLIEDSPTLRGYLADALDVPEFEVVGQTGDGEQGVQLCERLRPDVVSLDIVLHGLNGLEVTGEIMARCPCPILIVSASRNRGELFHTMDALSAGAVEVLDKPSGLHDDAEWIDRYRRMLRLVAGVKVIRRGRRRALNAGEAEPLPEPPRRQQQATRLIAIGASTGGPAALAEVLPKLPRHFPLPILLVLHLDAAFEQAFCEWLDSLSPLPVRMAIENEPLPQHGCVLLAPADRHLLVEGGRLQFSRGPERHSCRPSADLLFESLARSQPRDTLGIILTGMGSDGAAGLLALRRAGAMTLAQDEASSVIYGMPKVAADLGAVQRVVSLAELPRYLIEAAQPEEAHDG